MTPPRRVAIYARVYTAEQHQNGLSVEHQLAACHAHARAQHWEVAGIWTDIESGRVDDRAGYQTMLREAKTWDAILVWKSDRLGRDEAELFRVVKELRRADRALVSVTENVEDPFILGLLFLLAARESRLIGERVRPINQRLTREGRHVSRPPLPYRMEHKRLVIDEAELPRYLELVAALEAGASLRSICRDWNARGWRTRQGKRWQVSHLAKVARNPLHAGFVRRVGVEGLVPGQHPAVIDHARWQALQARLDRVREATSLTRPSTGPTAPKWLLTGFIRCACDSAMVHFRRTYQHYVHDYYACNAHRHAGLCPIGRLVRCEVADAAVEAFLAPILTGRTPTALLAAAQAELDRDPDADAETAARQRADAERALTRARARLATAADRLIDGLWTEPEYREHRARYQADLEAAQTALAALPPLPSRPSTDDLALQARLLADLATLWHPGDLADRRDLLLTLGLTVLRRADGLWLTANPAAAPFLPPRPSSRRASTPPPVPPTPAAPRHPSHRRSTPAYHGNASSGSWSHGIHFFSQMWTEGDLIHPGGEAGPASIPVKSRTAPPLRPGLRRPTCRAR